MGLVLNSGNMLYLQLDKAQTQHGRWQSMGNTNPDKRRLGADVEDECKSIAWQVRLGALCKSQHAARPCFKDAAQPWDP